MTSKSEQRGFEKESVDKGGERDWISKEEFLAAEAEHDEALRQIWKERPNDLLILPADESGSAVKRYKVVDKQTGKIWAYLDSEKADKIMDIDPEGHVVSGEVPVIFRKDKKRPGEDPRKK